MERLAIIQARLGSTRFVGKCLKPVPFPEGPPLLNWIVDAARRCTDLPVVLATTLQPEDDRLEEWADRYSVPCFRGSSDDVLGRFVQVANAFRPRTIVRLTGDNPFLDANILSEMLLSHARAECDYTYTAGLPVGMNLEIAQAEALVRLNEADPTPFESEHVTAGLRYRGWFNAHRIDLGSQDAAALARLRLTVDTPIDYATVCHIARLLNPTESLPQQLLSIADCHPWLVVLNEERS